MPDEPKLILQARTPAIAELVMQCAKGELAFAGPDSLWEKVTAMGYNGNSLYYMVRAAEEELKNAPHEPD